MQYITWLLTVLAGNCCDVPVVDAAAAGAVEVAYASMARPKVEEKDGEAEVEPEVEVEPQVDLAVPGAAVINRGGNCSTGQCRPRR